MGLSRKSFSSRNIVMQQQGASKYGCFHRQHRAKLQSNAWDMLGGRWADMSTEYKLIVSTNSQLWGAQVMKDLNNSHFLLSPRWPLWRGSTVFKNTLEVQKLFSIFNYFLFSLFRQKRIPKINCLELGWGRSSDVQKWLQRYRGVAEVKEIITAGKRSQAKVARLVCEPSLVILSEVSHWILEKRFRSGNVVWHRPGSHSNVAGLLLKFQVTLY